MEIINFIIAHKETFISLCGLIASEVLSLNPKWQSNGIVQLIINVLKGVKK